MMVEATDNLGGQRLEEILEFLRMRRGIDFRGYKQTTMRRRISRRIAACGLPDDESYIRFLEADANEVGELLNTILINVTSFFRDAAAWTAIEKDVLPEILRNKSATDPIRVWSVGCASGEEPYTIAMLLHRALGESRFRATAKIYATDVDEDALDAGRRAIYTSDDLKPVPAQLRREYFSAQNGRFVIQRTLRQAVIFGRHNVIEDAPISRIDLLLCRNMLIYMDSLIQKRVLERLHYALAEGGFLMLGRAETMLTRSPLFTVENNKHRIFRRAPLTRTTATALELAPLRDPPALREPDGEFRTLQSAVNAMPAAFLALNADGSLTTCNAAAREMFGLSRNDIGRPFQDLEVSYRPVELRSRIGEAVSKRRPVSVDVCSFHRPDGEEVFLTIEAQPFFDENKELYGTGIFFYDVTRQQTLEQELRTAREELDTASEELQSSNEELETTNEELQSTNEELETTNEELQSANEELETTNEELHSTNEELGATNDELRVRTGEAERYHAYLETILRSVGVGIIVLDRDSRITSWNRWCENMWGLRSGEVIGEKIGDLDVGFPFGRMNRKIRSVLQGREANAVATHDAINRRGRETVVRVLVTPMLPSPGDEREAETGVALIMEGIGGNQPSDEQARKSPPRRPQGSTARAGGKTR